jgi:hypothetical protein
MRIGCAEGSSECKKDFSKIRILVVGVGTFLRTLPYGVTESLRTPSDLFSVVYLLPPAVSSAGHNVQMVASDVHGPVFTASHVQDQFY